MRKSAKKALSLGLAAAMVVGLGSGITPQTAEAGSLAANDVAAYTKRPYRAYLCFQDSLYNYRDPFDDDAAGITFTELKTTDANNPCTVYASLDAALKDGTGTNASTKYDNAGVSGYDWTKMFMRNTPLTTETTETEFRDLDGDGTNEKYTTPKLAKAVVSVADFESPDVSYDGTYTVSMKNFDPDTFKYSYGFRMLYADTTIPYSEKSVKFTNVSLKIDGVEVYKADTGITRNTTDSKNTYQLMVVNEYGYGTTATNGYGTKNQKANSCNDGVPDPIWEAAKTNGGVINMPKQSIEITFTVSGLGAAPAGYVPQDDNSKGASTGAIGVPTPSAVSTSPSVSLKKGKTFTSGNLTYKVTKASKKSGSATVAVSGVKKSAQKKTSLSVPKTVTNKKFKYKVTAVNSKAFSKCKKLKKVTLGANVTTIKKNAFAKCTKLNALKVNSKLKKVAKKAFAGCKQNIKVSGKSKKANIKALKKSGYKKFK